MQKGKFKWNDFRQGVGCGIVLTAGALLIGSCPKYVGSKEIVNTHQAEYRVERTELLQELINESVKIGKPSYKTLDFSKDTNEVLLARMLFGEARNCSDLEKVAIAYTAINRASDGKKWNGETIKESILKPWQYSCFNKDDPNREKLMNPEKYDAKSFEKCLQISRDVLSEKYKDQTNGATHYFNPDVVKPN